MKKPKKLLAAIMAASVMAASVPAVPYAPDMETVEAHSGRTDSSGGHHDYNNVSGLGPYHYHCGGYPAHLHPGGVCPYSSGYDEPDDTPAPAPKPSFKLKISKQNVTVSEGRTIRLKLNIASSKARWRSSNRKVAVLPDKGLVRAKRPGKTVISAKYKGQTVKCKLTVKKRK